MSRMKWLFFIFLCTAAGILGGYALVLTENSSKAVNDVIFEDGLIYHAHSNKIFTGVVKDTAIDKILEYYVIKGVKHGKYNYFYLDGQIYIAGRMKNNKNDGTWKYYYPNGQIECIGQFQDDLAVDKWQWFYSDGSLKETGWYSNGTREGNWIYYDKDGLIRLQRSFVKDVVVNEIRTQKKRSV